MLVVRGTKKFRDRVGRVASDDIPSTTVLGDWFANAHFWRPHMAVLVNERTFLPVVVPLAPATSILERVPSAIEAVLRALGADPRFIAHEVAEMNQTALAPTNSRSVLGVMRELTEIGEKYYKLDGLTDPLHLSLLMAEIPCGPLFKGNVSPDREIIAVSTDFGLRQRDESAH